MKFRNSTKLNYLRKARHRHGHGIHSPFLFRLITEVIENKKHLPAYKILRDQRDRMSHLIKQNSDQLGIQCFKGAILSSSGKRNLFKAVELPFRYGKLIFRLVNEFKPESIACCGPSFGLNLLYLALSNKSISVNFFQSERYLQLICQETLKDAGVQNVKYCDKENLLEEFHNFVFINLPFFPDDTQKLVKAQLISPSENNVLVVRGIHESERMESIWKDLIIDNQVRVSLDLFEIGIILFKTNLQKEHFILRF